MRFLSVSSQPLDFFEARLLRQSSERFGIDMEVIVDSRFDWEGWHPLEVIKPIFAAMPADEIVFITDLWDTFFCCGTDEIERKFLAFDCPTVFGCEVWSGPRPPREGAYPPSPTRFRYLNGGGWVTRAGAFLDIITALDFRQDWTIWAQMAFSDWFRRHPREIKLDYLCEIFQTLLGCPGRALGSVDGRVHNWETGSQPCLVHGNGRQFGYLYHLWNGLGFRQYRKIEPPPMDRVTAARSERQNAIGRRRR